MVSSKKQNQVVFYTVKVSSIKKFLIIDLVTGTGIYYVVKIISANVLIAIVGSIVGVEGIKRKSVFCKN
jgi:hypothetical protein